MKFKKGQIPWNKKDKVLKNCEICNNDFLVHPYRSKIARFCGYECYWEWRKTITLSEEHKRKISLGLIGQQHVLGMHWKYPYKRVWSKENIKKFLRRRKKSSLEIKTQEIIDKYNLPYKFVGNGKFFIERKNPDFVNVNGQKIAIEVFHRKHKELFRGGAEKWEKERKEVFKKYGWNLLFFDETQINEKYIMDNLTDVRLPKKEVA